VGGWSEFMESPEASKKNWRSLSPQKNSKYFASQASQTAKNSNNKEKTRFCASNFLKKRDCAGADDGY